MSDDSTPDGSTSGTSTPDSSSSGPPEPEERWQRGLPHCSTGEHRFEIRGLVRDESAQTVTVSIVNTGVEAREIESVGIDFEYLTDGRKNTIYDELYRTSFSGSLEGGDSESYEVSDFNRVFWEDAAIEDVRLFLSPEESVQPCWEAG
ncbi:hypothetical protein [Halorientalis persicus]|uniref:hypothetical protein n=1 Tax=Halorientalis persicus TaxID=1367881 RepID=UPI0011135C4D|nr:hypothetical protein [Halorientalis persicus]